MADNEYRLFEEDEGPDDEAEGPGRPRKRPGTPLAKWIEDEGGSSSEVCDRFGLTPASLDRLARDEAVPSLQMAFKIQSVTGGAVPVGYWERVIKRLPKRS